MGRCLAKEPEARPTLFLVAVAGRSRRTHSLFAKETSADVGYAPCQITPLYTQKNGPTTRQPHDRASMPWSGRWHVHGDFHTLRVQYACGWLAVAAVSLARQAP